MLLIPEPPRYYCEPDEEHFFTWLQAIPAVRDVRGTPLGLEVTVDEPIDRVSFYELVGLLTRYGLNRRCLHLLCELNPDPWFRDPQNYWHNDVFGRSGRDGSGPDM